MGDDLEKCVICLSWRKCAHTRQHPCKGTPKQLCGPWAICVKCSDLVCQNFVTGRNTAVSGQFGCPICKSELGPRRRALEEGMEVTEWEVEPETPEDAWKMPVVSETQLAMRERNLPELRRLLDVKLPAEISAPVRAFMDARPELAAPPTPSTQRQRWAAVLSRLGIAAGQQKAGAASASSGRQSVAESVSAPLAPRSAASHLADAGGSLSDHYFGSSPPGQKEREALQSVGVLLAATSTEHDEKATKVRAVEAVAEKEAIEKARFEKAVAAAMAEKVAAATAKAAAEKAAAEKAAAAKVEQEKAATAKRRADRAAAENLAAEKALAEKVAAKRAEAEKAATEKRRAERAIAEKAAETIAVEKAVAKRAEAEKAATEKRRAERAVAEKAAAGKAAIEKAEKAATEKRRADRAAAEMAASEKAAAEKEIADKMAAAAEKMAAAAEKMAAVEKAAAQRAEFGNAASENAWAETAAAEKATVEEEAARENAVIERAVAEQERLRLEAEHRRRKEVQEEARVQVEAEHRLRSEEHERLMREEEQERLRKEMEQVLKSAQRRKDERLLLEQKQQRQEDGRRRLVPEHAPQPLGQRRNLPPETPAQACRGLDDATLSRCPDGLLRSFFAEYVRDESDCILIDDKSNRHSAASSSGGGAVPTRRPDQDAQMEKASARLDAEIATIRLAETARRRSSSAAAAERARFQSEQHAGLRLEVERQREQERLQQLEKEKRSQWKALQLQERKRREADAERHQLEAERRQEVEHRQREADRRRLKEEEARLKMKAELRQREEEKERILVAAERRRRRDEEAQFQKEVEQERLRLEQEHRRQEKETEQTLKEAEVERQRRQNEQERLRLEQERRRQDKEKEQTLKESQAREREAEKLYWLDVARREMEQVRLREGDGQKQALELKRQQLEDEERRVAEKRRLLDAQEQMLQQKRQRIQKEDGVKQLQRSREASPIRTVVEGARPVHTPVRASRPQIGVDASCSKCPDHVVHAVLSAHSSPGLAAVEATAGASAHNQPVAEARQIMRTRPNDDVKGRQQIQGLSAGVSSKRCDVETVLDEVRQRRPLLAASGKMGHSTAPSLSPTMKDGALLSRIKHRMHSATKENVGVNSCVPASSSSSRFISHVAHDTKKPLQPCGQKRRRDVESSARKTARTESSQRMPSTLEAVPAVPASKAPVVRKLVVKEEVVVAPESTRVHQSWSPPPPPTPVGSGIFEDNRVFSPVGNAAVKTGPPPAVVHAPLPASELVPPRSKVATATAATSAPAFDKRRQAAGAVPTMSSMLAAFDALQRKPAARMDKFPRR